MMMVHRRRSEESTHLHSMMMVYRRRSEESTHLHSMMMVHRRRSESAHLQQLVGRVVGRPHGLESFDTIQERVWEGSEPAILGARLAFSERLDDRGH